MLLGKAIVKKESVALDLEDGGGDKAGEASQAKGTEERALLFQEDLVSCLRKAEGSRRAEMGNEETFTLCK